MARNEIIEACARAICARYCPYELNDHGATAGELFAETVRLLETDAAAIMAWLSEF